MMMLLRLELEGLLRKKGGRNLNKMKMKMGIARQELVGDRGKGRARWRSMWDLCTSYSKDNARKYLN